MQKIILLAFFICVFSGELFAQRLPLWELGGAVGAAQVPYYRGASESRNIVLPLPLAAYRGKKYQVDRDGARRWFFNSDRVDLDFSVAGGLPVPKGGQVKSREGMPALDAMIEVGPALEVKLWKHRQQSVSLYAPLRFAHSVDWFDIAYRGAQFTPFLHYKIRGYGRNRWEFNIAAGPQFASKDYHAYYYGVDSSYITADRAAYNAKAGYSGSRVTFYANKRLGNLWLSVFARYDNLKHAVFEDSPLLDTKTSLIGGMVFGWIFVESPRKVYVKQSDRY